MGQDTALRLTHRRGDKIFRSDELKLSRLAAALLENRLRDFGILKNQFLHGA